MNKILLGDSQEILKTIDDGIVHLTCTSPPYYNARSYSIWPTYAEYLQFLTNVFEQVLRVTQPGRMCCVNLSPVIQARESRAHESKRLAIPFQFFSFYQSYLVHYRARVLVKLVELFVELILIFYQPYSLTFLS